MEADSGDPTKELKSEFHEYISFSLAGRSRHTTFVDVGTVLTCTAPSLACRSARQSSESLHLFSIIMPDVLGSSSPQKQQHSTYLNISMCGSGAMDVDHFTGLRSCTTAQVQAQAMQLGSRYPRLSLPRVSYHTSCLSGSGGIESSSASDQVRTPCHGTLACDTPG